MDESLSRAALVWNAALNSLWLRKDGKMNRTFAAVSSLAVMLAAASSASAGTYNPALDYVITLNSGNTFSVTNTATVFNIAVPDTGGDVVGFSFQGTLFIDPLGFPGQPAQTQLTITAPNASTYTIGGMPPSGASWDFQTSTQSNNFTHNHGPDLNLPDSASSGMWTFSFLRVGGFPSVSQWSNVTITLHSVPAPGALALLGIAAMGRRRRRMQ